MPPSPTPIADATLATPQAFGASLLDPWALAIVLVGTLVATFARAGAGDVARALSALGGLWRTRFDPDANRTALARWARSMRQRGLLGADEPFPPDRVLARALDALVRTASLGAFQTVHETARATHIRQAQRAAQVFEQAGDLAPVFGLVGTLFALTQIAPDAAAQGDATALGAIATAVLSSLYGVLSAHLVFLPLAQAIARQAEREEEARAQLVEWLAAEAADVLPGRVTKLKPAA
ncbi:MAG: MotA/TolQ/ExbB proton channel family protein [Pseudomonadota bacterium]